MAFELMIQPIVFGGVNNDGQGGMLGDNVIYAQNVRFNIDKSIEIMRGNLRFGTAPTQYKDGNTNGLYQYLKTNTTTDYFLAQIAINATGDTQCYKVGGVTGTWSYLSGSAAYTTGGWNSDFKTLNNIGVISWSGGVLEPYYWIGGDMIYQIVGAPKVKYLEVHYDRVVGACTDAYKSRIVWSDITNPYTWTGTEYADINADDGDEIVGIKSYLGDLYVFKRYRVYKIIGDNFSSSTGNKTVVPMTNLPGCVCHKSIVIANGKMYWLSYSGFIEYDGGTTTYIGKGLIDETVKSNLVPVAVNTLIEPYIGVHNIDTNEIWWHFTTGSQNAGSGKAGWIYNYILGKWSSKTDLVSSLANYLDRGYYKQHILMGGNMSGYVRDYAPYDSLSYFSAYGNFDGSAISFKYTSDWLTLGYPYRNKKNFKLLFEAYPTTGYDLCLSCKFYDDYHSEVTTAIVNLSQNNLDRYFSVDIPDMIAKRLKISFETSKANNWVNISNAAIQFEVDTGRIT